MAVDGMDHPSGFDICSYEALMERAEEHAQGIFKLGTLTCNRIAHTGPTFNPFIILLRHLNGNYDAISTQKPAEDEYGFPFLYAALTVSMHMNSSTSEAEQSAGLLAFCGFVYLLQKNRSKEEVVGEMPCGTALYKLLVAAATPPMKMALHSTTDSINLDAVRKDDLTAEVFGCRTLLEFIGLAISCQDVPAHIVRGHWKSHWIAKSPSQIRPVHLHKRWLRPLLGEPVFYGHISSPRRHSITLCLLAATALKSHERWSAIFHNVCGISLPMLCNMNFKTQEK
ncbi:hypothetical protein EJ08DRAFT_664674 [Tothia fuscella]|uniref:Uncharacterized protein n=1 Tax=Tothia fuscella TaxID=1048955 RepID=A0A9P4NIM7_9PEZI|nr:hypothetical protein EJ08DRAFT_664674 [Tothia fuscella]